MKYLYRLYGSENQLLYVGISVNPQRRLREHKSAAPWAKEVHRMEQGSYPLYDDMAATMEHQTILSERPKYNLMNLLTPEQQKLRSSSASKTYRKANKKLTPEQKEARMARVVQLHALGWTLQQIADDVGGISRQRVQQILLDRELAAMRRERQKILAVRKEALVALRLEKQRLREAKAQMRVAQEAGRQEKARIREAKKAAHLVQYKARTAASEFRSARILDDEARRLRLREERAESKAQTEAIFAILDNYPPA